MCFVVSNSPVPMIRVSTFGWITENIDSESDVIASTLSICHENTVLGNKIIGPIT